MHEPTPFQFEIDAEVFEKTNAKGESEYWVGGVCTTDHIDQEGERLLQGGLDFRPFLDHGYFNDNHGKDTGAAVGKPMKAELRKLADGHMGWYVEGPLFKNSRALGIMELANELERSGDAKRKLGFSVEGTILDRDPENPTTVRRAVVREVAITRCPVNAHTSLQRLAKSLSVGGLSGGVAGGEISHGSILSPESLEGGTTPPRKKRKKKMRKSEAVAFLLSRNSRLTRAGAEIIVNHAIQHFGQ